MGNNRAGAERNRASWQREEERRSGVYESAGEEQKRAPGKGEGEGRRSVKESSRARGLGASGYLAVRPAAPGARV